MQNNVHKLNQGTTFNNKIPIQNNNKESKTKRHKRKKKCAEAKTNNPGSLLKQTIIAITITILSKFVEPKLNSGRLWDKRCNLLMNCVYVTYEQFFFFFFGGTFILKFSLF